MQRYFVTYAYGGEKIITLKGEEFHHISRVMRMKTGDEFYVVFLDEKCALVKIESITTEEIFALILEWKQDITELPIHVTIASGLPKGDKLEQIVQKGTELGAYQFVPFTANRSIVKWNAKKEEKNLNRLEKIAKEAAEQSHRTVVPEISSVHSFNDLIKYGDKFTIKVVAYEEEAKQGEISHFASTLKSIKHGDNLLIVFGPEGGLSEIEIIKLKENNFEVCGLGPRILRTETAPLYTLSAISYHFELMG